MFPGSRHLSWSNNISPLFKTCPRSHQLSIDSIAWFCHSLYQTTTLRKHVLAHRSAIYCLKYDRRSQFLFSVSSITPKSSYLNSYTGIRWLHYQSLGSSVTWRQARLAFASSHPQGPFSRNHRGGRLSGQPSACLRRRWLCFDNLVPPHRPAPCRFPWNAPEPGYLRSGVPATTTGFGQPKKQQKLSSGWCWLAAGIFLWLWYPLHFLQTHPTISPNSASSPQQWRIVCQHLLPSSPQSHCHLLYKYWWD